MKHGKKERVLFQERMRLVCCLNLDRVVCVAGEIVKQTREEEIFIVLYVHGMEYEAI